MTDEKPERTPEEELAALDLVIKALKTRADALREQLPAIMAAKKAVLSSAFTDDGRVELARVRRMPGNISARLVDERTAIEWCAKRYPERLEDVVIIDPGFVKSLLAYAAKIGKAGDKGVDPKTGERLDFITVIQGDPFVKVEPTPEGKETVAQFVLRTLPELTA